MFCTHCGTRLNADAAACPRCGARRFQPAASGSPVATRESPDTSPAATVLTVPDVPEGARGEVGSPEIRIASAWRRLFGHLIDAVLLVATLIVGWIVWTAFLLHRGQTPGKQILRMQVVHKPTLVVVSRGRMAARTFVLKPVIFIAVGIIPLGFLTNFLLLFNDDRQELWDEVVHTIVIDKPATSP